MLYQIIVQTTATCLVEAESENSAKVFASYYLECDDDARDFITQKFDVDKSIKVKPTNILTLVDEPDDEDWDDEEAAKHTENGEVIIYNIDKWLGGEI